MYFHFEHWKWLHESSVICVKSFRCQFLYTLGKSLGLSGWFIFCGHAWQIGVVWLWWMWQSDPCHSRIVLIMVYCILILYHCFFLLSSSDSILGIRRKKCIRSPVQLKRSKRKNIRSAVWLSRFLIRLLAVRSAVRMDGVRNVFVWEVTYCFLYWM